MHRSQPSSPRRSLRHVAAAALFVLLALVWSWPLANELSTHLPGAGLGDNVSFVWDFWWMRVALATDQDYFRTTYLFAPLGADLTLHSHVALHAFLGATALKALPVLTAHNVVLLAALLLNGFSAYLLAWRLTRDSGASILGGMIYAGSPYISAHLNGHFNLTSAWTIPLFALAASEAVRGSVGWAVLSGLILGATAYLDYYYVIYEMILALSVFALAARNWSISFDGPNRRRRRLTRWMIAAIAVDVAAITGIVLTGGFDGRFGPIRVAARDVFNPLQILWVLVALAAWLHWRPRVSARAVPGWEARRGTRALLTLLAVFVLAAAPIVWKGIEVLARGEYVTQTYFWRSAPKGIDVATLFLGNAFHGAWGGSVRALYEALNINIVESGAWLGIVPVVLVAWTLRRNWGQDAVRHWTAIGALFFVWSLGPHLMAFGRNTGMILPQALMRYVPIVENARIPGRAMVVVYLALGMLSAMAIVELRRKSGFTSAAVIALGFLVVADYVPAPFPLSALDRPGIYETLRDRHESGAVCELPLGTRDSFSSRGHLDHRVLFYQTIHGRPLVGGVISRLPPSVVAAYDSDPLISALLRLSEDGAHDQEGTPPDRKLAADLLKKNGIAFVMLNRSTAPAALVTYVEQVLPLTRVAEEGERSLYLAAP